MGWQTTITKQGLAILAGLGGGNIEVSAWAGMGIAEADRLQEQTALINAKQKLPVIEDGKKDSKRFFRLQVTNNELAEKYTLNQLGVFVSINGGEPLLYYLAQNPDGDEIPSNIAVKNFIAEYVCAVVFAVGDKADCDDKSGFITPDALDARLDFFRHEIIAISEDMPYNQPKGGLWFNISGEQSPSASESGITFLNAVVTTKEPIDKSNLWLQT